MSTIEEIDVLVQEASTGNTRATILVDELRSNPNRWSIGLKLFFESTLTLTKFFGLSLVREFLSNRFGSSFEGERGIIRSSVISWITTSGQLPSSESFLVNNIANIIALSIKHDFPDQWPSAFVDILQFSSLGVSGMEIIIRILQDIDIEVVMFNEKRTQIEIQRNNQVKDAMREGNTLTMLVAFLCNTAWMCEEAYKELSEKCLLTLAEFIGWIDISLIINDNILPQLYKACYSSDILRSSALMCLYEVVKKGMDGMQKIELIQSINLLPVLSQVPFDTQSDEGVEEEMGQVVDVICVELLTFWTKFEAYVFNYCEQVKKQSQQQSAGNNPNNDEEVFKMCIINSNVDQMVENEMDVVKYARMTAMLLQMALPLLLKIFMHVESTVAVEVLGSVKKLITVMKSQMIGVNSVVVNCMSYKYPDWYFKSMDCFTQLLTGIYQQSQYPSSYSLATLLEEDDEDIVTDIEARKEIRKIFVNCCRVAPHSCLQLIDAAFASLPNPLSTAPFPQLEAVLRFVHCFSEMGGSTDLINEGRFPQIVQTIFQTDIPHHTNALVLMAYYEIAARYTKLIPIDVICYVVSCLVSTQGLRHSDLQLRSRSAYLLLKITESLGPEAGCLLQCVGSFTDLVLTQVGQASYLSDQAEIHLLESIGLMTVQANNARIAHVNSSENNYNLLADMLNILTQQIASVMSHSQFDRYSEQFVEFVARRFGSIAALARGHHIPKQSPNNVNGTSNSNCVLYHMAITELLYKTCSYCVGVIEMLSSYRIIRNKGIIFLHRMLPCIGSQILVISTPCIMACVGESEPSDIEYPLQIINQYLVEFNYACYSICDKCFNLVINKITFLYRQLPPTSSSSADSNNNNNNNNHSNPGAIKSSSPNSFRHKHTNTTGAVDSTLENEKIHLLKLYLTFIQHLSGYDCHSVLISNTNISYLPEVLSIIYSGLEGGNDSDISLLNGYVLRRLSVSCLTNLCKSWLVPHPHPGASSNSSGNSAGGASRGPTFVPTAVPVVPDHISLMLISLLCNQSLPLIVRLCTIDPIDIQSQGFIIDTANLIWTMLNVRKSDTLQYFQNTLLPNLNWPPLAITSMMSTLTGDSMNNIAIGTFRDVFKRLMKSIRNEYCNSGNANSKNRERLDSFSSV